jgi:ribosome-binding factor A
MRQFKRSDRLAEQMRRDISVLLEEELTDLAYGLVTFTHVRLTDDLRFARVYYSFLGGEREKAKIAMYLEERAKRIRARVGKNLHVRHIPELTFVFDRSVEEGIRIEQLFDEIESSRKKNESQ